MFLLACLVASLLLFVWCLRVILLFGLVGGVVLFSDFVVVYFGAAFRLLCWVGWLLWWFYYGMHGLWLFLGYV